MRVPWPWTLVIVKVPTSRRKCFSMAANPVPGLLRNLSPAISKPAPLSAQLKHTVASSFQLRTVTLVGLPA
jgi:predicted amidophosphoribosyltransferase